MMLLVRDDSLLETFDSPENPPSWIEWIDVANGEYAFSDDRGQRYEGLLEKKAELLAAEKWKLVPRGPVDIKNAFAIVDRAVGVDPDLCIFSDLISAKAHLTNASNSGPPTNTE